MKLEYRITDEARKKIFVETGANPGSWQQIEADPVALSADDRRLLVALSPNLVLDRIRLDLPVWRHGNAATETITLAAPVADVADLLAQYRALRAQTETAFAAARDEQARKQIEVYRAWNDERPPQYSLFQDFAGSPLRDDLIAAYNEAEARAAEIRAAQRAARQRKEDEAAAEKAARLAERAAWAAEHGSSRLKKCVEQGYDCQRLYVFERAALEYPGYVVDFNDKAAWKSRSAPSEAALDEAASFGGEAVWMTIDVDGEPVDEDGGADGVEAVAVANFLGKYYLVKAI